VGTLFAQILRRQRLARGLTQQELAERARLSERSISDLERGVKTAPRLITVRLLIEALGLEGAEAATLRAAVQPHQAEVLGQAPTHIDASASHEPHVASPQDQQVGASVAGRAPRFDIQYAMRADGAATAYAAIGAGPVLIHPPGLISHLEWFGAAPGISRYLGRLAEHRTLVLYDRHGCGFSDRNRIDFTSEDDMQDMEAVAGAVGPCEVDLLGVSFGSGPAITYAARHPELVRRLVLYGPNDAGLEVDQRAPAVGIGPNRVAAMAAMAALRRADLESFVRAVAVNFFPSGVDGETFRSFVQMFRIAATPEMQEQLETVRFDLEVSLPKITVPTLVLHRRGDQATTFARGQALARRIPGARFVPLEGDAHFPWVGDWQSVVDPMLNFLLSPSSRPSDTEPSAQTTLRRGLQ
jgi:pimeloyl-ACP methyl ester carboxylesterase/transcriptional regulator with XRE-family HTH domain